MERRPLTEPLELNFSGNGTGPTALELIQQSGIPYSAFTFDGADLDDDDESDDTTAKSVNPGLRAAMKAAAEGGQEGLERHRAAQSERPVEKGKCPPHQWDRAGERCLKCNDKDWM
jgi:hypothetical protein